MLLPWTAVMTLNIMVFSRRAVFLTADFRLTWRYASRRWITDEPKTQKIVPWHGYSSSGLVAFSGFAEGRASTSTWLEKEISKLGPLSSLDDLASSLKRATSLVAGENDRRLTFCLVGFSGARPVAQIVSNFQGLDGPDGKTRNDFRISTRRPSRPEVFVGGQREAVRREDIERLKRAVSGTTDWQKIHHLLAEVNASAADLLGPDGSISRMCFTSHALPDGSMEVMPHFVPPDREFLPAFSLRLLKGVRLRAEIGADGKPLPRRFIGMTGARNSAEPNPKCTWLCVFRNVQDPEPA